MSGRVFLLPADLSIPRRERKRRIDVPRHIDPPAKTTAGGTQVVSHDLVNVIPGAF